MERVGHTPSGHVEVKLGHSAAPCVDFRKGAAALRDLKELVRLEGLLLPRERGLSDTDVVERPENPTERWLAMSELRRRILSAQVTHALNEQLDRHSPDNVRKVAGMKVPSERDLAHAQYGPELPRLVALKLLHREILWAQVRVALNEKLGRTTADSVLRLAKMELPDRAEFDRARAYDEANSPQKNVVEPSTQLIHPGVILLEEFIEPLGLAPEQVAQELGLNPAQFTSITRGAQDINAQVAALLAQRFELSERFWVNLQETYDRALTADP